MKNRVLHATYVLINSTISKPVLSDFRVEGSVIVMCIGVTVEIPRGIHECVHGVCFALRRSAALWTPRIEIFRDPAERRTPCQRNVNVVGKNDGQIFLGNRNNAVLLAIEHWDRRAPVALAGDAPIF